MAEQKSSKLVEYNDSDYGPRPPAGGYEDNIFLEPPPDTLICPVCLLVLKQPHLLSCCGAHLCQICIEHIKAHSKPCPCCREEDYSTLLNKQMRGCVHSLKVHCTNKDCSWTGELGVLEQHLVDTCLFTEGECRYGCGSRYPRHILVIHERDRCLNRPIEDRIDGISMRLDDELTTLEKKRDTEITELKSALKSQENVIEDLKKQFAEELKVIKVEMNKQNIELEELKKMLRPQGIPDCQPSTVSMTVVPTPSVQSSTWLVPTPPNDVMTPPCIMIMDNFEQHRTKCNIWHSQPCYSAEGGYKFCLAVHANGDNAGKGSHISLYVVLMKGTNDDVLRWPFKGDFTIQLLNWREDKNHVKTVIKFDEFTPKEWSRRLYEEERAVNGRGKHRFLVHSMLYFNAVKNTEFVDNDRLCLKLVKVDV